MSTSSPSSASSVTTCVARELQGVRNAVRRPIRRRRATRPFAPGRTHSIPATTQSLRGAVVRRNASFRLQAATRLGVARTSFTRRPTERCAAATLDAHERTERLARARLRRLMTSMVPAASRRTSCRRQIRPPMTSLSIQFYATLDEVAAFARRWLGVETIHAVAVEYRPFTVSPTTRDEVEVHVRREGVRRLVFAEGPIDCSVHGNNELLDKNEGALILDIGRPGPSGLDESRVSATKVTVAWRKIAADLKQHTSAGMVGVNERTGATAKYGALRYTQGAAALEESGTPLRPFEQSPVRLRPDS